MDKSEFSYRQALTAGACKSFITQAWVFFNAARRNSRDANRVRDVLSERAVTAKRAIDELVALLDAQAAEGNDKDVA